MKGDDYCREEPIELVEFLAPYPEGVQEQALRCRETLLRLLWPVTELHFDATAAVCAGFSYTPKTRDIFVNIAVYGDHVTLVFGWGAKLDDPERRLKGQGNQVRHIRLKSEQTLHDPYIEELILQASALAAGREDPSPPSRVIKIYDGPKRRPS